MSDTPLDMLVVGDIPAGTFAVADALQGLRIVHDGFKSRAEAEKFIEDYYLAPWRHRAARSKDALISFGRAAALQKARGAAVTRGAAFRKCKGGGLRPQP